MKLFAVISFLLLFGQVFCKPGLLGGILGTAGGVVGNILGGGGSSSQQIKTVPEPAPEPAPAPTINVNVQNIYNKQNNKQIINNNQIDAVNNNIVNNDVDIKQDIKNKAISNNYNNEEINNRVVNNNYRAPAQQPSERAYEPVQQPSGRTYDPAPRYAAGYENEREQYYKGRDAVQAETEREYSDRARSRGNYQSY